jgi:hypothetical protein
VESADAPKHSAVQTPVDDRRSALLGTLPLAILTVTMFIGAYVVYARYPGVGPGDFRLWGLFLTLGFVAAIGTVVSWFFATDEPELSSSREDSAAADTASRRPSAPVEFGRPTPDAVSSRGSAGTAPVHVPAAPTAPIAVPDAAPWDEDVLPPPIVRGPRPVLPTLDDPGEIDRALEEIEEIQRELAARPPPMAPRGETAARA